MLAHLLMIAGVSALSALAAGVWARRTGRDAARYAVLGALLGPLLWVLVWAGGRPGADPPRRPPPPPPPDPRPPRPPQPSVQGSMRRTSPVRRTTQKPRTPIGRR